MTPEERNQLQTLDDLILNSTEDELKKIQEIDLMTQMDGMSFFDIFTNSKYLASQSFTKKSLE